MKIRVFAIAAALAIGAPASASAATYGFGGSITGGGEISFKLVKRSKTNIFVKAIRFVNVTAECGGQPALLNVSLNGRAYVDRRRRFRALGTDPVAGNQSKIQGRFNRGFRRATGTMRLWGNFYDGQGGTVYCDTQVEDWAAKRGG